MSTTSLDIAPSVADVAALLRARTGSGAGTFNDDTRPTSAQVLAMIHKAEVHVRSVVGVEVPEVLQDAARSTVALATACLIELAYRPEQVRSTKSDYAERKALLDIKLRALRRASETLAPAARA
jgi:hypothetical protein